MINRKAILISVSGNPNDGKKFIPGVKQDLKLLSDYLSLDNAGAWETEEIYKENNPNDSVLGKISQLEFDFTVTLFSGHGAIFLSNGNLYLECNGRDYPIQTFLNKSSRQLLICDSCRSYYDDIAMMAEGKMEHLAAFSDFDLGRRKRLALKEKYNSSFMSCEGGFTVMYAASKGEGAGLDDDGSYFVRALVSSGNNWIHSTQNGNYDVKDAIRDAQINIKNYMTTQKPEISQSKRYKWFPFAVK